MSAAVTEPTGDWGRNIAAIELRQCGLRQSRFQFESCSARGLAGERERERERAVAVENRETAVGGRFYSQKTVGVVVDSRGEKERREK